MATRSKDTWQPVNYVPWLLGALVCAAIALIIWGVVQRGNSIPAGTTTPSASSTQVATPQPTPHAPSSSLPAAALQAAAGKVLDAYYSSSNQVSQFSDLSGVASPEVIASIKEHWNGFPSDMSVTATITYPIPPIGQDDGTVTLDARVETVSNLGEAEPEELVTTAIVHFSRQGEGWIVYDIEEVDGDATGEDG